MCGGPVGLTAALMLSKAGYDFVLLEARPQVVEDVGASLTLFPHTIRILAQLGLLNQLREYGQGVVKFMDYNNKGLVSSMSFEDHMIKSHGQSSLMFHRAELVQCIYDALGEEGHARCHVNKRVTAVDKKDEGVVVTCQDGSTYEGGLLIGADGVHSRVRDIMREHMLLDGKSEAEVNEKRPFPCTYKTIWCPIPGQTQFFAPGDVLVTHSDGCSLQMLNAERRAWLFVYEKLDKPTTERVRFTEADIEAFVAKHADMMVGGKVRLGDLIEQRRGKIGMANLEEGVLKHWSYGRMVLAGDACHKYTPNAGQGLNNGIQDLAALGNELFALHTDAPTDQELTAAFTRYQAVRAEPVVQDYGFSARMTRLSAWPNWLYWFADQWVMPNIPFMNHVYLNWIISPPISKAFVAQFIETEEPFEGTMPWAESIPKPGQAAC
ncbi:hypothetical protein N0V82_004348 [Gnomoniopsis sp. IMI 355080]|nr:hypothetical protein N0V82_004348 [Gnomoniopsis sp. IMI 355080]